MRWLPVALAIAIALSAGCTGGGESTEPSPFHPEALPQQVALLPLSQVPRAAPPPGFEPVFVENLSGLIALPQATGTMPTDLQNFAPEVAQRVLDKVQGSFGALYIAGETTDVVVSFEAYRFPDPRYAAEVLEVYKTNWNNRRINVSGREMWIWEGYKEQVNPPSWAVAGSHIFWDSIANQASLSGGDGIIANLDADLYCYHGEAALGNYFVMVDVHLPKDRMEEAEGILREYLSRVEVNATPVGTVEEQAENASIAERIARLEAKKEEITQAYLENQISLEVYNYTLSKIEEELRRLRNRSESP